MTVADPAVVRPFALRVPDAALEDLRERLDRSRWPDELDGQGWAYGIPRAYLEELARYWRHEYDWRAQEARLNALPNYVTEIDGADVHFVHLPSPDPDALALVITHGWPGSIVELLGVLGPLSESFHVVAPTIPGFGLSGPTREPGWDVERVAAAWAVLMERLGYDRYGAQGGDWGSRIAWELGRRQPARVAGVHVNMLVPVEPPAGVELTAAEAERLARRRRWVADGTAYMQLQATRPQTLAYALTDSPVGQLAWIAEKFHEWADPGSVIDRDDLLTNVMLYWLTGTAGSSARLYYEFHHGGVFGPPEPTSTPTGVCVFPHDVAQPLRRFAEAENNVVHWTEQPRGGHFGALEEPELLVADVRAFFRDLR
jgi:epoxide hydrolase